jgi:hypothetical protein
VVCILKTHCAGGVTDLVELEGGLLVTPWHPIWHEETHATRNDKAATAGSKAGWVFPCEVAGATPRCCEAVYSFVLEYAQQEGEQRRSAAAVMLINGVQCVTLGHGLREGKAFHPYFGTEAVIEDLKSTRGWGTGRYWQ